ncbi:MAG: hypothetical protein IPO30_20520 [Hyphomonadaceae bacterium]|nr:hypothetical protein [Hyphomonadaceae bacterium]
MNRSGRLSPSWFRAARMLAAMSISGEHDESEAEYYLWHEVGQDELTLSRKKIGDGSISAMY